MKVVGITSQREVNIASKDRNFRINEFLIVEDRKQGRITGEVVEAYTYNRYMPLNTHKDYIDSDVMESLKTLGYDLEEDTIYICRLRFLSEALYPIETGSDVRIPKFEEVKSYMINSSIEEGLILGSIKNTDNMYDEMDEEYKDLLYIYDNNSIEKQKEIPYIYNIKSMHHYPHIGIFGGSGSGKSFGLRVLLEEIMKKQFPTIVLDPHYEMDFSNVASYLSNHDKVNYKDKFNIFNIGIDVGVNFEDLSVRDLKNLLEASSPLTDSMKNVVDILFKPRDSFYSFSNRLKMLSEAQELGGRKQIEEKIHKSKDDEKIAWESRLKVYEKYDNICPYSSVRGIMWRLFKLENEGIFTSNIDPIVESMKVGKLVVIQGNTSILQVFGTYLFNNLYYRRREYKDAIYRNAKEEYFPPFIIVTDEAHNFAPKGYENPSKGVIKEISQEGRKYGVFLILATQRPTLLDDTVTAQLNSKFIFRTVRASDIETIREETDITSEDADRLPYLKTGDVFISSSNLGKTTFARIRAAETESPHTLNPFDEFFDLKNKEIEKFLEIIDDKFPINSYDLNSLALEIEQETGETYDINSLESKFDELVREGELIEIENPFGKTYQRDKN